MTALLSTALVAIVAAWASLYSARAFPTLERRIRDHVALLKDMPEGSAGPLRALVEDEIDVLVDRQRRRLAPAFERRANRVRGTLTVILLLSIGVLGAVIVAAASSPRGATTQPMPDWLAGLLLGLLSLAAAVTAWFAVRVSRRSSDG